MDFNLDEILPLDPTDLSNEQRDFLVQNKEQLSDEDVAKFGLSEGAKATTETKEGDNKGKSTTEDEAFFDATKLEVETRGKKTEVKAPAGDDDDDDDILPEDKKMFEKVIGKYVKPLQDEIQALKGNTGEQQHVLDTDSFIAENPEYKKYRAGIIKFAKDPAYANVAVSNIAIIVSGKDQQAIGAKKEREAQQKAKATQQDGNQGNTIIKDKNAKVDYLTMPKAEFEKERSKVLGQV